MLLTLYLFTNYGINIIRVRWDW